LHCEESLEEIAIISELLRGLDLKGCIVTTSAFGCHKSTAEQVVGQGVDYVLTAKANQPKRHTPLQHLFDPSDYQLNWPEHELRDLLRISSEPM
jgi:predicted transposase YbfD/YdcC